jgi:hypothetical protein
MKWPRIRLSVRALMIAIALTAVAMAATIETRRLCRLSREYRRKAVLAAREERGWLRDLAGRRESEADARRLAVTLRPRDGDLADLWGVEAKLGPPGTAPRCPRRSGRDPRLSARGPTARSRSSARASPVFRARP